MRYYSFKGRLVLRYIDFLKFRIKLINVFMLVRAGLSVDFAWFWREKERERYKLINGD